MITRRQLTANLLPFVAVVILVAPLAVTASDGHIGSPLLLEGCGSCHVGHGMANEPMLDATEEQFCYQCHSTESRRSEMVSQGKLAANSSLGDIEAEFRKVYRHPVEEPMGHSPVEVLPAANGSPANHAECVDCHNPHMRRHQTGFDTERVPGYSASGMYLDQATKEFEICLKCHADNEGRTQVEKNIRAQFDGSARSMHPVSRLPKGRRQVSLESSAFVSQEMACSACHTSDDRDGPQGPHGSRNQYLLSGNYTTDYVAFESEFAYEFCYSCHDRSSILGNESFPLHREHIEGDQLNGISGTSCYTCHASHSSAVNPYLIKFNPQAVDRNRSGRPIEYRYTGEGAGECYLSCHGYSHEPGRY